MDFFNPDIIWLHFIKACFAPLLEQERIFIVYMCSSLCIALWLFQRHKASGGGQGMVAYCFPKNVWWHASARQDYMYYFMVAAIKGAITVPLAMGVEHYMTGVWGGEVAYAQEASFVSIVVFSLAMLLVLDFSIFFTHYLQHKVPILWEFHKVHHSAEVLTPMTVFRMHPVDLIFTACFVVAGTVTLQSLWSLYVGPLPEVLTLMGLNAGIFVFYLFGYNLRHSHVWCRYPAWLSHILVSPAMHQIHHSSEERHWDKNMGFVFSFWDYMFKTLYVAREKETFALGLDGLEKNPFRSAHELVWKPFVWAWQSMVRALRRRLQKAVLVLCLCVPLGAAHAQGDGYAPRSLYLEELTWTETARALKEGYTSIIIPTGGTEQNGPHMVLGKHNIVMEHTAHAIAQKLGHTLVAPVMRYVPQGHIKPKPTMHMPYAGTLTVSEETFQNVLESAARSLLHHGFARVYFIGDSYGNQASQAAVAKRMRGGWFKKEPARVFHVSDYYTPHKNGQIAWLKERGYSEEQIGGHAGIRDTSEVLAIAPHHIRDAAQADYDPAVHGESTGVNGDPSLASAEIGRHMLALKIDAAVAQIQSFPALQQ